GLNCPRSEVHEPSPSWPSQGYMKVARHYSVVTTSCCDGGNVHLQELRRISGIVVLLQQVRAELGRPCQPTPATGVPACIRAFPRGLGAATSKSALRLQPSMLRLRSRALSTEMWASSPARLRLSSARRSSVRAPLTVGERTNADAAPWRRWQGTTALPCGGRCPVL